MNIGDCIGKRVLMTVKNKPYAQPSIQEWRVLEVSPSGNFVRLQNEYGNKHWHPVAECALVEVLKQFERNPDAGVR